MTKSLRQRHRQIWIAWAILLPFGITVSWLVIPDQQAVKLLPSYIPDRLPVLYQAKTRGHYAASIRTDQNLSAWQLEWTNITPLTYPSAVIYKTNHTHTVNESFQPFAPSGADLIGRIEARGDYRFPLPIKKGEYLRLVLYDFIHENIIDTLNFQL